MDAAEAKPGLPAWAKSILAIPVFLIALIVVTIGGVLAIGVPAAFGSADEGTMLTLCAWGGSFMGMYGARMVLDAVFKKGWNGWPSFVALVIALGAGAWLGYLYRDEVFGSVWQQIVAIVTLVILLSTGYFWIARQRDPDQ